MAYYKHINSSTKNYQPVLTDKLILDDVPTVNSLNTVTSDAVARAIAGASGEVPAVTENDNGKVLTAIYDEGGAAVEWAETQEPASKPLVQGANITITETENAVTIAATDTTYTPGNMVSIDASNAIGVSTTAGITDIQRVNALPADPVSTVLYLIPQA